MSDNFDLRALQQQMEELRRLTALSTPEPVQLPERRHFSAADAPELAKFEQFPSAITALAGKPPGNPHKFRAYPRCLYQAKRHPKNGKWCLSMDRPERWEYPTTDHWEQAMEQYRRFSESCLRTVASEGEHQAAEREGWRNSATEALEFREQEQERLGQEAAERNYRDRLMSEPALAESQAAEAEHFGHLPEIPERPVKRHRRTKAEMEAARASDAA